MENGEVKAKQTKKRSRRTVGASGFGSLTPEIEKKQRKKRRGLIFLSNCSHYICTMYHNVL